MCTLSRIPLLFGISMLFWSPSASAQKYFADSGYIEFESRAPALTFKGISQNLTGLIDLSKKSVDFYLDLNTIDTGIELRNRHMRESYLETAKFPFAEFLGFLVEPFDWTGENPVDVSTKGTFTIHGVAREIEVNGTITPEGDNIRLEARFMVALEDHNISRPRIVFYELSDIQRVSLNILLEKYDD
jgi:polyisoprenoid-binding protein YceI